MRRVNNPPTKNEIASRAIRPSKKARKLQPAKNSTTTDPMSVIGVRTLAPSSVESAPPTYTCALQDPQVASDHLERHFVRKGNVRSWH